MTEYKEFYRRVSGGMRHVWSALGHRISATIGIWTQVCAAGNVSGKRGPWSLSRYEGYRRNLHEIVGRVLGCVEQSADPASRPRCRVILRGGAPKRGGDPPPQPESCQISAGIERAEVVCRGVLYCPCQRLNHRGRHRSHWPEALRSISDGGQRIQCWIGGAMPHLIKSWLKIKIASILEK